MAANTIAMCFKVEAAALRHQEMRQRVAELGVLALGQLSGEPLVLELGRNGDQLLVYQGQDNSHATVRVYSHGLLTLDVQHYVGDNNNSPYDLQALKVKQVFAMGNHKAQLSEEYIRALETKLRNHLGKDCVQSNSLYAPIRRGQDIWPYAVSADERLMELDYDQVVFETMSRWQSIRIYHSREHGNVLFLDGDLMLGESDLVYTQTLCGIGSENYHGKEVLILGGGDGAILHELLKEKPKMVTMAEIDMDVIEACRTHMRSVCGDAMDQLTGAHHQIIVGDCVNYLHQSVQEKRQFDFVINDLTEFPVDKEVKGFGYDFDTTSLITELSLKVLRPGGKLLARGNCLSAEDYRASFEGDLHTLGCEFRRKDVYVPSFHETYCLYEIWHQH